MQLIEQLSLRKIGIFLPGVVGPEDQDHGVGLRFWEKDRIFKVGFSCGDLGRRILLSFWRKVRFLQVGFGIGDWVREILLSFKRKDLDFWFSISGNGAVFVRAFSAWEILEMGFCCEFG